MSSVEPGSAGFSLRVSGRFRAPVPYYEEIISLSSMATVETSKTSSCVLRQRPRHRQRPALIITHTHDEQAMKPSTSDYGGIESEIACVLRRTYLHPKPWIGQSPPLGVWYM